VTVVPAYSDLIGQKLAVPLPRYARIIRYSECKFFGVNNPDDDTYQCTNIWTRWQREMVMNALYEAELLIEQELHYHLYPKWDTRETHTFNGGGRYVLNWARFIQGGIQGIGVIEAGATVSHVADPAVVVVATTVTDEDEIAIYHPGSTVEILASSIVFAGGNATISIPRCRMVKESLNDTPVAGLDYTDTSNFEATVDVKRVYNDASTHAFLVNPHECTTVCLSNGCAEHTQTACILGIDNRLGIVNVHPADYDDGWSQALLDCCGGVDTIRFYYQSGLPTITRQLEEAVIRLAHTLMADEPCGCDAIKSLWRRDRDVPELLTRDRLENPFGVAAGAWYAWNVVRSTMQMRGGVI